ncbi:MAG: hypothetical protein RIR37_593 [Verrucomicrobiota bacterium]|jgi:hypothetical protein
MSGHPQVSILMPLLNQACFLREALDSILAQSHADLELIVIDGASTDGSLDILRDYAERDSRIRWSSAPDSGPAEAVNKAARQARGEVIGWLNSDDLYEPSAIEQALGYLRAHPDAMMVYGQAEVIDAEKRFLNKFPTKLPSTPIDAFVDGCFICQPTVFMRRSAWIDSGELIETLQTSFDLDLWLRVFKQHQDRIGFIDRIQAYSRQHEATITSRNRRKVAIEALMILKRHLDVTPIHWMLTHVEEIMARHPDGSGESLREKIASLMEEASRLMKENDFLEFQKRIAADRRIALAGRHSFINVHPDGWAGPTLTARVDMRHIQGLKITGHSGLRAKSKHRLTIQAGQRKPSSLRVRGEQPFEATMAPGAEDMKSPAEILISSDKVFRPCETEPGSTDQRELSIMVNACEELT